MFWNELHTTSSKSMLFLYHNSKCQNELNFLTTNTAIYIQAQSSFYIFCTHWNPRENTLQRRGIFLWCLKKTTCINYMYVPKLSKCHAKNLSPKPSTKEAFLSNLAIQIPKLAFCDKFHCFPLLSTRIQHYANYFWYILESKTSWTEDTSLIPCNETGCSFIRDKRMEIWSFAISSLSLDLADSVTRVDTILCNIWILSAWSLGALWKSFAEGVLILRQRMGRYLSGIWKQFPVEKTRRACRQRIPENSKWWQLQLMMPSLGAQ